MTFELNQIFEGTYPPEASKWCNANNAYMLEIEPAVGGVRRFKITEHPQPAEEQLAELALQQAKAERAQAVQAITVEVDGMVFDGDEDAMRRASTALTAVQSAGLPDWRTYTVPWVLKDNTVATVTMEQLARMLQKAMEAMAELWVLPYTQDAE